MQRGRASGPPCQDVPYYRAHLADSAKHPFLLFVRYGNPDVLKCCSCGVICECGRVALQPKNALVDLTQDRSQAFLSVPGFTTDRAAESDEFEEMAEHHLVDEIGRALLR